MAIAPTVEARLILHLVTDRRRLAGTADWEPSRRCVVAQARYAIEAGIDVLQIRERDLEASSLARLVVEIVAMARGSGCRVVVNDRLDVALACGADGVHLRGDSVPPAVARGMGRPGFLVGRSVHGLDDARKAAGQVDYLIAGTVWASESKPGAPSGPPLLGTSGLEAIAREVATPVLAIGGVTLDRIGSVAASGAAGAAAIGLFMGPGSTAGASACRAIPLKETVQIARRRFDTRQQAS